MITLGKIIIKDHICIAEARNKIHILAQDLKHDSTGTVRLATITSELSRLIYQKGRETYIDVGFEKFPQKIKNGNKSDEIYGLILLFHSKKRKLDISMAKTFFDVLEKSSSEDGYITVKAVKYVPDPNFQPTTEFIELEKDNFLKTSKRELFNEVKNKNEELLKILAERNQAFADLEEKNKAIELATQLKSEFLANMSHELRTPLNSIIGFTRRVIKKASEILPGKQLQNLKRVEKNAHHLLGLINSVLDLSKIEAGKMDIFPEEFILGDLIEDIIDLAQPLVSEKNLTMDTDFPEKQLAIYTDKTKLKQILINLVSNAAKFTETGGIMISARILEKNHIKNQIDNDVFLKSGVDAVAISVIDTGSGMTPEETDYIFEAFRQVDGSITRKVGGTGLGLSISKKFANLLQGKIEVSSEKGKGSTFTVTIPVEIGDIVDVRK